MAKQSLLSREQIELQLSQIDLLRGMYPEEDEIFVDAATERYIDALREWSTPSNKEIDNVDPSFSQMPSTLTFDVQLDINSNSGTSQETPKVLFSIEVPIREQPGTRAIATAEVDAETPPPLRVRLRQPPWLNRTQTSHLNASIPSNLQDDIFATIDHLRDEASTLYATSSAPADINTSTTSLETRITTTQPLHRVWFYFPSLSTRSKRADLVNHAPTYSLTGFVLAGKPGLLVVEGTERDVDAYMRYIKTESWGDIPSYQKKVSERYREVLGGKGKQGRVFEGMQEITEMEWMGDRRGERGNRGDMKALEGWLRELGLENGFERVLF